jgi:hypothetical protein
MDAHSLQHAQYHQFLTGFVLQKVLLQIRDKVVSGL